MPRKTTAVNQVAIMLAVVAFLVSSVGCRTVVTPPATFSKAVPICLAHYDMYHTSLVVPADDETAVDYTYGDWDLFAKYDRSCWPAFKGMTFPTQGALGKRVVRWDGQNDETLRRALDNNENCHTLSRFKVSEERLKALRARLEEHYSKQKETEHFNKEAGVRFVKYKRHYTFFHNCNHELADWLEELGCTVKGWRCLARFEVNGAIVTQKKETAAGPKSATDGRNSTDPGE